MKAVKTKCKTDKTPIIQFKLLIFYKPACSQKNFMKYYSSGYFLWTGTMGWVIAKKSSPKNLSVNCRPSVDREVTDSLPTANQQVTNRLRKKKNCGKHEQLT